MVENTVIYKKPLFSIVIVNYNGAKYLEQAILSILNQSCQDFELLIIDGKSNDGSLDIIKKYETKLAYWVSEKDNGQSDAFNKGFEKAKGEFYFWVNSDDILWPRALEKLKTYTFKFPEFKWFAGNTVFFNSDGKIKSVSIGPKWNDFLLRGNPIYVQGPSSVFHHSLFEAAGGMDTTLHYTMDGDLWYRFYNMGYKFKRVNGFIWGFRIHFDSKTSHAFNNLPNEKFKLERIKVKSKNNHETSMFFSYLLMIYKVMSGSYVHSKILSVIMRNRKINTFN